MGPEDAEKYWETKPRLILETVGTVLSITKRMELYLNRSAEYVIKPRELCVVPGADQASRFEVAIKIASEFLSLGKAAIVH